MIAPMTVGNSTTSTASTIDGLAVINQIVPSAAPFAAASMAHAAALAIAWVAATDSAPSPSDTDLFIAPNRGPTTASAAVAMNTTATMATTSHAGGFGHSRAL